MKSKKIIATLAAILFSLYPSFANAEQINYSVKTGDSLWKLSSQYKTTVSSIVSLNNLNVTNFLYIGQPLKIQDNRIKHTIIFGDNLWKISQYYKVSIAEIKTINNLTSDMLYIGQVLIIPVDNVPQVTSQTDPIKVIETVNYKVVAYDNLWTIAQKYKTTMLTIKNSNMLATDILMPGQILTVPVNSTEVVKPQGITMMSKRANDTYGDLYTWENGRRLFTVGAKGIVKDLQTGITFNVKYYGGSNHADIVPLTITDTNNMKKIFPTWSWSAMRPMILSFTQGTTNYQLAVSLTGMPHSTSDIYDNGISGHFDMYFYNSTSHSTNELSPTHQNNILKANGR
jgi:LysM repeat protein